MTEERLMPCPFCGTKDREMPPVSTHDRHGHFVICTACSGMGATRPSDQQAITAWNTRQPTPAASNKIEALRALLNGIAHPTAGLEWSLPWKVRPCDGKPTITSHLGGNLFRGYIATWKEADLVAGVVNALPEIIAALQADHSEVRLDHERLTYAGMMAAMRAVVATGKMEALDLYIFKKYVHGQNEERGKRAPLPQDVINLVIAGREAWELLQSMATQDPEVAALDKALEAFADRVPYDDEPEGGWLAEPGDSA